MLTCHSLCQLWAEAKGGVSKGGREVRGGGGKALRTLLGQLGFVHRAPTLTPRPDTSATLPPVSDSLRRWRGIKVIAGRKQRYRGLCGHMWQWHEGRGQGVDFHLQQPGRCRWAGETVEAGETGEVGGVRKWKNRRSRWNMSMSQWRVKSDGRALKTTATRLFAVHTPWRGECFKTSQERIYFFVGKFYILLFATVGEINLKIPLTLV